MTFSAVRFSRRFWVFAVFFAGLLGLLTDGRRAEAREDTNLNNEVVLRIEGLALSWIGTGRFIFSLNYTDAHYRAVADRFMAAARAMQADGWWWTGDAVTNRSIKRRVMREMIASRM